ncbi:SRPBCC family protein [Arsenicitalea aurantiaca]|uniref:SRPBCC family protein n=1 Tax=Arsenicitalea aurantiaca TaxID=1783274 RepID=A0A433XKK6_9HYPH|nr:SRPBCC family protein [Arsenicitalea aurantiaca]RUT34606.1 SRPBCC family protein [Arsenicitalea aurantiaca]
MFNSRSIGIRIGRPFGEVYAFLSEPRNFPSWGPMHGDHFEHLGGRDYLVDLPGGRAVMTFAAPNSHGVLDFTVTHADRPPLKTPARLHPNDEGCELTMLLQQRRGVTDAQFASEVEWMSTDLETLKSLLESRAPAEPVRRERQTEP